MIGLIKNVKVEHLVLSLILLKPLMLNSEVLGYIFEAVILHQYRCIFHLLKYIQNHSFYRNHHYYRCIVSNVIWMIKIIKIFLIWSDQNIKLEVNSESAKPLYMVYLSQGLNFPSVIVHKNFYFITAPDVMPIVFVD